MFTIVRLCVKQRVLKLICQKNLLLSYLKVENLKYLISYKYSSLLKFCKILWEELNFMFRHNAILYFPQRGDKFYILNLKRSPFNLRNTCLYKLDQNVNLLTQPQHKCGLFLSKKSHRDTFHNSQHLVKSVDLFLLLRFKKLFRIVKHHHYIVDFNPLLDLDILSKVPGANVSSEFQENVS